jgi:hypothetical protein
MVDFSTHIHTQTHKSSMQTYNVMYHTGEGVVVRCSDNSVVVDWDAGGKGHCYTWGFHGIYQVEVVPGKKPKQPKKKPEVCRCVWLRTCIGDLEIGGCSEASHAWGSRALPGDLSG